MKKFLKRTLAMTLCALTMLATAGCAKEDVYPSKEIRMIVNYTAGGQSDVIARKLVDVIQKNKYLSQPLVVVNMAGGGTKEGITALTEAKPDGYTLMFHHNALLTIHAAGQLDVTVDDLDFVAGATEQSFLIVANDDFEPTDISAIIDESKETPNDITVGFAGFASPGHFALLDFLYRTQTQDTIKQIVFTGGAEAIQGQLGGQVDLRSSNSADCYQYIESGDVKPVVILAQEPNKDYPDVPTMKDLGIDESIVLRSGVFAPKGTPDDIKATVAEAVEKAVADPEFVEFVENLGGTPHYATGADFKESFIGDMDAILELKEVFADAFE